MAKKATLLLVGLCTLIMLSGCVAYSSRFGYDRYGYYHDDSIYRPFSGYQYDDSYYNRDYNRDGYDRYYDRRYGY